VVQLPRSGPQRSGYSAGTMPGFPPFSFPPRKRGPRNRGGAVATKRTSAQRAFRQHDARVLLKTSTLRASEPLAVRCPFGCRPELGGPWVPAFAGKTKISFRRALPSFPPRKRGPRSRGGAVATKRTSAQWVFRRHGARAFLKRQHPPCRGGCSGSMSFWLPSSGPWSLGPGVRRENEG